MTKAILGGQNPIYNPLLHQDTKEPTGFLNWDAEISFDSDTRIFSITGAHSYYNSGVKVEKGTSSFEISSVIGMHYIYYGSNFQLTELVNSFPGMDVPLVAFIYWNGILGAISDERHGCIIDSATHNYLHSTIGVRYGGGLSGTFTNTTFSISPGSIWDEDLHHELLSSETHCKIFFKNGSANWNWLTSTPYYYYDNGTNIYYNNGNTLSTVASNAYVAYWCFMTNDIENPIIFIAGQRTDLTLANAKLNNTYESLVLGEVPFKEMKLLYRIILRGDKTYIETQDLRGISNLPSGTYIATSHDLLTGLNSDPNFLHVTSTEKSYWNNSFVTLDQTIPQTVSNGILTFSSGIKIQPIIDTLTSFVINDKDANNILTVDTINNRIGIGLINPTYKLDVQDSASQIRIKSTIGTNSSLLRINNTGGDLYLGRNDSVGTGLVSSGGIAYSGVLNVQGIYPLQLATNSSVALTILNGGYVGIGTTNPISPLQISFTDDNVYSGFSYSTAEFSVQNNSSVNATTAGFSLRGLDLNSAARSAAQLVAVVQNRTISGLDGTLCFITNNAGTLSEKMRISPSGNIGIGTSSPGVASKLTIDLNGKNWTEIRNSSSSGGLSWYIGSSTSEWGPGAGKLLFSRYTTPLNSYLIIDHNGNIGIKNTYPSYSLDVSGAIRSNDRIISTLAIGTAPFEITSTTLVSNLNVDLLDGFHASDFAKAINNVFKITGDFTLSSSNQIILADALNSIINVTLPVASTCEGKIYQIKKIDNSSNKVILLTQGTDLIDGLTTFEILFQYQSQAFISDGIVWYII